MSQIFISYASEDRPWVEPFAKTLEQQGWSVWWDRHIPTGHTYDDVIWSALQTATCVVVVWSSYSIGSEWVKEEASEAKKRNILLPVRIDEARPPFGFSRRQTQSLIGWQEGIPHRGYDQLLTDIAQVLKAPPPILAAAGSAWRARLLSYLWLILPTLAVLVTVLALMAWRVPTHVEVDLTVDRVEFTVGQVDGGWANLLGPLDVQALAIRDFSRVKLTPSTVEAADPRLYDFDTDTYPAAAWHQVAMTGESLEILAGDVARHPSVTLRGVAASDRKNPLAAGRLDSIAVTSGSMIMLERASASGASVTVEIRAERPRAGLTPGPSFQVSARATTLRGMTIPDFTEPEGQTYRISLKDSQPSVEVDGGAQALALTVRPQEGGDHFKGGQALPITKIDFFQQGATGGRITGLTEGTEAVLRYTDVLGLPVVRFGAPDYLALEQLERFVIKDMEWSAAGKGIRLALDGVAGHIATKSGEFKKDLRLAQFDRLRYNTRLLAVLAILGWAVPTIFGARKVFKEWR